MSSEAIFCGVNPCLQRCWPTALQAVQSVICLAMASYRKTRSPGFTELEAIQAMHNWTQYSANAWTWDYCLRALAKHLAKKCFTTTSESERR